jgi:two-component system, LytTR family, response regulator
MTQPALVGTARELSREAALRQAPWRVVVADDEPLARLRIRTLLSAYSQFQIVAECSDGIETLDALARFGPDVLFLDVRMPQLDGLAVAETIGTQEGAALPAPAVVFVTAYDVHAANAFDLDAIDYLVKPVDVDRFSRTLTRIEARLTNRISDDSRQLAASLRLALSQLNGLQNGRRYSERFAIRSLSGVSFVATNDIDWIDADGNYVGLWVNGRRQLLRDSMNGIMERLDPAHFIRVHRSAIVAINRIRHIEPGSHGEYVITMSDGTKVESSRTYSASLQQLMR